MGGWVVGGVVGVRSLRPRSQIRLAAEINASESETKCAATIADSVGDGGWGGFEGGWVGCVSFFSSYQSTGRTTARGNRR